MRKTLILILFLALTLNLQAVNFLKGKVVDDNGKPIKTVKVSINDNFVFTNTTGEYLIEFTNRDMLEIVFQKAGYQTINNNFKLPLTTNNYDVTLKKEQTILKAISITASKKEQLTKDIPVKVDLIHSSDIQANNNKNVDEVLSSVPGIEVESNGYSRGTVKLQGLPAQYTLVLIDGERTKGGHNGTDVSQIPVEFIERIEVVKGPASALYGSDALGGVVNIITKKPANKPDLNASYSLGTNNTNIYQIGAGYGKNKWGILTNARRFDTDGRILSEAYKADNIFIKTTFYDVNQYSVSTNLFNEKRNLFAMAENKKDVKLKQNLITLNQCSLEPIFTT